MKRTKLNLLLSFINIVFILSVNGNCQYQSQVKLGPESIYYEEPTGADYKIKVIDAEIGRTIDGFLLQDGTLEVCFAPVKAPIEIKAICELKKNKEFSSNFKDGRYEYYRKVSYPHNIRRDVFKPVLANQPTYKHIVPLTDLHYLINLSDEHSTILVAAPKNCNLKDSEVEVGFYCFESGQFQWQIKLHDQIIAEGIKNVGAEIRVPIRFRPSINDTLRNQKLELDIAYSYRDVFGRKQETVQTYSLILP